MSSPIMEKARWEELMRNQDLSVTPEELSHGWHFCWEWDGLLVGPGMMEYHGVSCGCMPDKPHPELAPPEPPPTDIGPFL